MKQGEYDNDNHQFYDSLSIHPSYVTKYDNIKESEILNHLVIFDELYPSVKIVESYHYEVYDLVIEMGFDYDLLWNDKSKIFRPLMFAFKNKKEFRTSYGKCYCIQTLTELSMFLHPDLFEPTSISES
jgi:hypothetical protein